MAGQLPSPGADAAGAQDGQIDLPPTSDRSIGDASSSEVPNSGSTEDPANHQDATAVEPTLLAGDDAQAPPSPDMSPRVSSAVPPADAALARAYEQRFRPAHNPVRFNLGVRALFANAGGNKRTGGRLGGAQVDIGQTWNRAGYAVTASAWGGRVFLPRETGAEMNALFGLGPTVALGRLALLGRGFLDLRLGYDFLYGVVNERRANATVVAPQSDPDAVRLIQTDNLMPHGPRLALQMGLLSGDSSRRFFHGFGVSMGYQALVHSFRGELPFTHMLTIGIAYWMG